MRVRTYADAQSFLSHTQLQLELNEAANSLMLGVCLRLVREPDGVKTALCLKSVEDESGLIVAAMMTPPHKLVVYGHRGDLDAGARALADDLVSEGWEVPGVLGPKEVARRIAERWSETSGQRCELVRHQRVYELREVRTPVPERGRLRLATVADTELAAEWRYAFNVEVFGQADLEEAHRAAEVGIASGDIYLWEDERPVSMAAKSRPTRNGISVSFVYTPPESRGRGLATACVAELSRMLLASGWRYCALFADLANASANRMYQRIGYAPACEYDEYVFLHDD